MDQDHAETSGIGVHPNAQLSVGFQPLLRVAGEWLRVKGTVLHGNVWAVSHRAHCPVSAGHCGHCSGKPSRTGQAHSDALSKHMAMLQLILQHAEVLGIYLFVCFRKTNCSLHPCVQAEHPLRHWKTAPPQSWTHRISYRVPSIYSPSSRAGLSGTPSTVSCVTASWPGSCCHQPQVKATKTLGAGLCCIPWDITHTFPLLCHSSAAKQR